MAKIQKSDSNDCKKNNRNKNLEASKEICSNNNKRQRKNSK